MREIKCWNRCPESLWVLLLQRLSRLNWLSPRTALSSFEINPLKKEVDWMTSRGPFHAQLFCNFMKPEGEI